MPAKRKPHKTRHPRTESQRKFMELVREKKGRNPRCRNVTITAPDGRVGAFNSIYDCAIYFGITPITMEARIRRSYTSGGHPGWEIEGRDKGLYRAWFTDKGDPGMGEFGDAFKTQPPTQPPTP